MPRVLWAPVALHDLDDIYDYVSQDSPTPAEELISRIQHSASLLAENPEMGRARDEIEPGLRHFPIGRGHYVIYYRPLQEHAGVEIARVLHASLDVRRAFGG